MLGSGRVGTEGGSGDWTGYGEGRMEPRRFNFYFQEADLKEAFKIFDRDKDGFIDMKELKKVSGNYFCGNI